jgi:hypothetical protein
LTNLNSYENTSYFFNRRIRLPCRSFLESKPARKEEGNGKTADGEENVNTGTRPAILHQKRLQHYNDLNWALISAYGIVACANYFPKAFSVIYFIKAVAGAANGSLNKILIGAFQKPEDFSLV